jgi:hypothetical protein
MKLQKAKFGFSTKEKYIDFELEIKVSADYRFFFSLKDLPKELQDAESCPPGRNGRCFFDSFYELNTAIQGLIDEVEVSLIDELKTKVIIYSCDCNDRHGKQLDFRWRVVQKLEIRKNTKKHGETLDVSFFEETKSSSDYQVSTNLRRINTHDIFDENFSVMAWTSEREAWFQEMDRAIAKVSERLVNGFGAKAEVLARKIDQGAKLLIASGEE